MPIPAPLLIAPLVDFAGKIFDRIFPDKNDALRAKAEFSREMARMDSQAAESFRNFVIAYEGSGASVHPILQILRGSVRPVLTYVLAGLFAYGFLHPETFTAETMRGLFQLNLISLGFWYGERALKRLGLDLGKPKPAE